MAGPLRPAIHFVGVLADIGVTAGGRRQKRAERAGVI
jgi:hypothetical protein